jgi:hypothetical protein
MAIIKYEPKKTLEKLKEGRFLKIKSLSRCGINMVLRQVNAPHRKNRKNNPARANLLIL